MSKKLGLLLIVLFLASAGSRANNEGSRIENLINEMVDFTKAKSISNEIRESSLSKQDKENLMSLLFKKLNALEVQQESVLFPRKNGGNGNGFGGGPASAGYSYHL